MLELNKVYNMNCLDGLKDIPDKYFDLLVTDPPYAHGKQIVSSQQSDYYDSSWDKPISQELINEMIRVSKNQIIFGAEHLSFMLPKSRGWIIWDKRLFDKESNNLGDAELIWTSFDKSNKIIRYLWNGFRVENKEVRYKHPTQKPLNLMIKLLKEYSSENDKILDCFAGSGSTLVACKHLNRQFLGFEISREYCDITELRLNQKTLINSDWFNNEKTPTDN